MLSVFPIKVSDYFLITLSNAIENCEANVFSKVIRIMISMKRRGFPRHVNLLILMDTDRRIPDNSITCSTKKIENNSKKSQNDQF